MFSVGGVGVDNAGEECFVVVLLSDSRRGTVAVSGDRLVIKSSCVWRSRRRTAVGVERSTHLNLGKEEDDGGHWEGIIVKDGFCRSFYVSIFYLYNYKSQIRRDERMVFPAIEFKDDNCKKPFP